MDLPPPPRARLARQRGRPRLRSLARGPAGPDCSAASGLSADDLAHDLATSPELTPWPQASAGLLGQVRESPADQASPRHRLVHRGRGGRRARPATSAWPCHGRPGCPLGAVVGALSAMKSEPAVRGCSAAPSAPPSHRYRHLGSACQCSFLPGPGRIPISLWPTTPTRSGSRRCRGPRASPSMTLARASRLALRTAVENADRADMLLRSASRPSG